MLTCFKKKKPKSEPPHACCCCCRANCANFIPGPEGIQNGKATKIDDPQTNYPPSTSTEDGNFFSKRSGTLPITTEEDSDSDKTPSCYVWGSKSLNSDSIIIMEQELERDEDKGRMPPVHDVAWMPVSKNNPFYNMNHPRRGKAVIFNFDHWDNTTIPDLGLSPRKGSEKDKNDLAQTLRRLEFEVYAYDSCTHKEMWNILDELRDEDHSMADCLVVCIMTHGERNTVFVRDGTQIPVNLIWEAFEAHKCPTLAGKPKIFIVQACRGKIYDNGTTLNKNNRQLIVPEQTIDVTDSGAFSYVIPNSADFLIAFSCPLGHYSWRNPQLGSWFIQSICKVFDQHGHEMDLQSLLTEVAREVALNFTSNTTQYHTDKKKQVTSTSSTLIRKVIFKPKKLGLNSANQHSQINGISKTIFKVEEQAVTVQLSQVEIQVESNV